MVSQISCVYMVVPTHIVAYSLAFSLFVIIYLSNISKTSEAQPQKRVSPLPPGKIINVFKLCIVLLILV